MWSDAIKKLKPASVVEELPDSRDDERLGAALAKLESHEIVERSEGIKLLSQYAVRESVAALARVARTDAGANLRGLAISSLATINHESVFPSVLIGMADESREVRAAAARSLSRLSFDRADAYLRVMETDDANTLRDVAHACVKAGVAAQAIDRLGSGDRRQAYEALSVLSLLARADVLDPVVKVIANHPSIEVRINALRLLGTIGNATILEQLRQLAVAELPKPVKMALKDTIAELETDCEELSDSEDAREKHEMESVECVSEQHEMEDFATEVEHEHHEISANEWAPGQQEAEHFAAEDHERLKMDSVECVSGQQDMEKFEADSEELVPGCLECVPEKPAGEHSGLSAPRIA